MDAGFLNDLLECSVCLEQLDGTSKVLPCQHTFCKQCLEEIVHMHKELRCPECRVLVETRIDELPSNILLIRLLEGIKNNTRFSGKAQTEEESSEITTTSSSSSSTLLAHRVETSCSLQPHISRTTGGESDERQQLPKHIVQPSLCAKALHSHEAKEPGDLSFKKGDIILLRKRIDQNWYRGELNGKSGLLPANYVQVVVPAPPQCKALYDFRVNSTDEKDCLTFSKGDLITVIRRVDENWAEGKLSDKIGIFPISFVEMNAAGRTVMKLASNALAGPSRIAPPTPIAEESHVKQPKLAISPPLIPACADPTSTPSSPSNPSTPCSSSSSLSPPTITTQASDPLASSLPTSSHGGPISHVRNAGGGHHSEKRNSLCAPSRRSPKPSGPQRHSMEILNSVADDESLLLSSGTSQAPPVTIPPPPLPQQWSDMKLNQRHGRKDEKVDCPLSPSPSHVPPPAPVTSNHGSSSSTHAVVPIFYIALFNYKPQKEDELELRKGELYTVSEKCQDGWFKGTSLRCGKSGVFPGNYVQVAKSSMLSAQFQQAASSVANIRPASSKVIPVPTLSTSAFGSSPISRPKVPKPPVSPVESNNGHHDHGDVLRTSIGAELLEWARSVAAVAPQKLQQTGLIATPQHKYKPQITSTAGQHAQVIGVWPVGKTPEVATMTSSYPVTPTMVGSPTIKDVAAANGAQSWHGTSLFSNCVLSAASAVTSPPNVSVRVMGNSSRMDRKERKEQQREKVSLMKRLTSKRKSRSPPLTNYSCDNPSFVDTPCSVAPLPVIHVRSGSCPNEALGSDGSNHKKTGSLDGSSAIEVPKSSYRPKQPVPLVRERFRCIVPYPPNSEYELELKIGDVVYVQKKRDDGWYKGTQQRTGKTGLFPASFVENF